MSKVIVNDGRPILYTLEELKKLVSEFDASKTMFEFTEACYSRDRDGVEKFLEYLKERENKSNST